jgi:hypothetical protein
MTHDQVAVDRVLGLKATAFVMTEENCAVFAWYGQAVALAQLLEASLVAYLAAAPASSKRRQRDLERQARFVEMLDKKALGELRDELSRFPQLRDAAANIDALNELRIGLVHHWFRDPDRVARFDSAEGRLELIAELREAVDRLGTAAAAISANSLLIGFRPAGPPGAPKGSNS